MSSAVPADQGVGKYRHRVTHGLMPSEVGPACQESIQEIAWFFPAMNFHSATQFQTFAASFHAVAK